MKHLAPILIISFLLFNACTKKNESFFPAEIIQDNINGQVIKYTIQLSAAANPSDTTLNLFGAKVYLAMNDTIYVKNADSIGMISFGNLADGNVTVRIEHPKFYTYNYIVNLKASDSIAYESTNFRNSSSIIRLIPKTNIISASLKGHFFADLDLNNAIYETCPEGIGINAYLSDSIQLSLAEVSSGSSILDAWIEMPAFYTESNPLGEFDFTLPVMSNGLKFTFKSNEFYAAQMDTSGFSVNKLFSSPAKDKSIFPYSNNWLDFYFSN